MGNIKKKEENDVPKVSYIGLFRYSNIIEKIMVALGILGAIGQGVTMPIMIQVMGDLINIFISLVITVGIKKNNPEIQNDEQLKEFFTNAINNNSTGGYGAQYGSDYDYNSLLITSEEFWNKFHKYMLYFGLVALLSFVGSFCMDAFLSISALRQVTRIRSLTFKSIVRQEIPWHEKTSPGELASRIISDTIIIEDGIGFKLAFISGWKLALSMSVFSQYNDSRSYYGYYLSKCTKKSQDAYAKLGGMLKSISQIRTIVSFVQKKELIGI
ncbi:hypothetical protein BCR32DRAFT_308922 [Anaeromyces robustus]|uniref:ABC transmembrane type-1 domain-containing protein n=1 Tax=Anaeromyces robustus TaxID=1754192 RepID=A0A1Y1UWR9_9FUNG|nr:hypothetical protein BCR32DRAFT_308922 [Anaeromyces robustus]|eukprot:ORX42073.1 hypothetical protein BCR32DRAFT_308922 [Anaeromyces robustus]